MSSGTAAQKHALLPTLTGEEVRADEDLASDVCPEREDDLEGRVRFLLAAFT
jgi:hypothetical protein